MVTDVQRVCWFLIRLFIVHFPKHVKILTILDDNINSGPDGKLKIEDRIFDLPSGYTTTYSNLNENIRKNKERSRQNNQEMDLALNQSLMENLGISGK